MLFTERNVLCVISPLFEFFQDKKTKVINYCNFLRILFLLQTYHDPFVNNCDVRKKSESKSSFHAVLLKKKNMKTELNSAEIDVILTSFKYSKKTISEYPYPEINPGDAYKSRTEKLNELSEVEAKMRDMKKKKKI
jgi:hypothetical protein